MKRGGGERERGRERERENLTKREEEQRGEEKTSPKLGGTAHTRCKQEVRDNRAVAHRDTVGVDAHRDTVGVDARGRPLTSGRPPADERAGNDAVGT